MAKKSTEKTSNEKVEKKEKTQKKEKKIDKTKVLEKKVKELESEIEQLKDDFLRKNADLENFRKRLIRDKQDAVSFANTSLIKDLLATLDNLELAINSSKTNKDFDSFVKGVELVQKHLIETLEQKWGLKKMESQGQEFNPQHHEACMMETDPSVEIETVSMDLQTGYFLHDRVLRPAKVKVAKPE